jgi:hypothetical protein
MKLSEITEEVDVVAKVFAHFSPDLELDAQTREFLVRDIKRKAAEGWLPSEIAAHLRYSEEINPDMPEEKGLAGMTRVFNAVKQRLAK